MDPHSGCGLPEQFMTNHSPLVKGPIKYKGQEAIKRDIDNFKAGLKAAGLGTEGAWMNAIAPASCARMPNEYYKSEEELLYACADAMREEYKAIIDAGLSVPARRPGDRRKLGPAKGRTECRRLPALHQDVHRRAQPLDQGAAGRQDPLPPLLGKLARPAYDRHPDETPRRPDAGGECGLLLVRGRQCPARTRVESVEGRQAARRKKILPGIVTHSTNLIEDPELVADRICRFADVVGRDNVIASTDCGLGGRVHPQIAWAKLKALSEGAALASKRLWQRAAA